MKAWREHLRPVDPSYYSTRGDPHDPRIADVVWANDVSREHIAPKAVMLIGFPQDEGVRRNSGRVGAAAAPDEIRRHLGRLVAPPHLVPAAGSDPPAGPSRLLIELGNVICDADLEASQQRLAEAVAAVLEMGGFPIILGGGHETAYGHFLGYARRGEAVRMINVDAHLDVRPLRDGKGHSGSPFRQALEHPQGPKGAGGYLCIGVQRAVNAAAAFEFMHHRAAEYIELDELLRKRGRDDSAFEELAESFLLNASFPKDRSVMLSVDLDSVRQADAPGVSAPAAVGFSSDQLLKLVRSLAAHARSIDIVECNPRLDRDGHTARLAARLAYEAILAHV
jgi:formiminoglutamase